MEPDIPRIVSGTFRGRTTGAPVAVWVENRDVRSAPYEKTRFFPRPGHADLPYLLKYGAQNWDYRGGGRASARETVGRVIGGAASKKLLMLFGTTVAGYLRSAGRASPEPREPTREEVLASRRSPVRGLSDDQEALMSEIEAALSAGDSVGGVVEVRVYSPPSSLGEPVFDKLKADLAKALMSIPAATGFEYGLGWASSEMRGREAADSVVMRDGRPGFQRNVAGGLLGGLSTGDTIVVRVSFKPTSSTRVPVRTVDLRSGVPAEVSVTGRHDPCVAVRAVAVCEAMVAMVLADHAKRAGLIGVSLSRWQASLIQRRWDEYARTVGRVATAKPVGPDRGAARDRPEVLGGSMGSREGFSFGGISVVNALGCGLGATMAVDLRAWAEFRGSASEAPLRRAHRELLALLRARRLGVGKSLDAEEALRWYMVEANLRPADLSVTSEVPRGVGLKSSSAFLVAAFSSVIGSVREFSSPKGTASGIFYPPLIAAQLGFALGFSVTGALDDALASHEGGVAFADNVSFSPLGIAQPPDGTSVVIGIGGRRAPDLSPLSSVRQDLEVAFQVAWSGDLLEAMSMNGRAVARALGYDESVLQELASRGVLASGVSGNGPAVFAVTKEGDEGPSVELFLRKKSGVVVTRPVPHEGRRSPFPAFWGRESPEVQVAGHEVCPFFPVLRP